MTAPAATYGGRPDTSAIDRVRFLIGDTNTVKPRLRDSEIAALVTLYGAEAAPAEAAAALSAKYAGDVDYSSGKSRRSLSQLQKKYQDLSERLRRRQSLTATPWAGGIDPAEHQADLADSSITDPAFERDQFRNPEAPKTPGEGYRPPR